MKKGYILLYRRLQDSPLWKAEPFTRGQAWVDLLLLANHAPKFLIKRGVPIKVNRGQVGVSMLGLGNRWKWSQGKISRFLTMLQTMGQIDIQKSKLTTLITIRNYNEYQPSGEQTVEQTSGQTENKRRTNGEQTGTNNELKNELKNERNKYGELRRVKLTDEEHEKLVAKFGQSRTDDLIEKLDLYIAQKGDKYKSHYAALLNFARREDEKKKVEEIKARRYRRKVTAEDLD